MGHAGREAGEERWHLPSSHWEDVTKCLQNRGLVTQQHPGHWEIRSSLERTETVLVTRPPPHGYTRQPSDSSRQESGWMGGGVPSAAGSTHS